MTVEATAETMRSYLDAFLARGDFADYFTDEVTWTTVGGGQDRQGRQPVRKFLVWMHTRAFDAHPKVKSLVIGGGQAALEADFVGTHTVNSSAWRPLASQYGSPTAWSSTCGATRSLRCAPTSPWTCSPNSSSELYRRFGPLSGNRVFAFGPQDSRHWAQLREGPAWRT